MYNNFSFVSVIFLYQLNCISSKKVWWQNCLFYKPNKYHQYTKEKVAFYEIPCILLGGRKQTETGAKDPKQTPDRDAEEKQVILDIVLCFYWNLRLLIYSGYDPNYRLKGLFSEKLFFRKSSLRVPNISTPSKKPRSDCSKGPLMAAKRRFKDFQGIV